MFGNDSGIRLRISLVDDPGCLPRRRLEEAHALLLWCSETSGRFTKGPSLSFSLSVSPLCCYVVIHKEEKNEDIIRISESVAFDLWCPGPKRLSPMIYFLTQAF